MMTLQDWKNTGAYFDFKGHKIYYKSEGTGIPLLLLHGFPTSSWDWVKIWQPLAAHYQLIAPDFLGFGFSDKPRDFKYSLHQQADLVEALLLSKGITKVHLLVHDYAVSVAQELMARFHENDHYSIDIQSVAFLNGGIFPEQHRPLLVQKLLRSPIGFIITRFNTKQKLSENFDRLFGDVKPTEAEMDDFWAAIQEQNGHLLMHKLIGYIDDRRKHRDRWVNALKVFPRPKILINGLQDPVSGEHAAVYFREQVPEAELVMIPESGHYPQTECPEKVVGAYLEFRK
jgi:pimeloyl-ACP methyl ester carboxylesterase